MAEDKPDRGTKQIVRLAETNLDGGKPVRTAIRQVKGVSVMMSNAVSIKTGLGDRKLSELSDAELRALEDAISNPGRLGMPGWLLNRRRDPSSGADRHISASALDFIRKNDIDEMKKAKSYKGIRHIHHLPVRGQRTRGSFRKGKTVGVSRKKQAQK